MTRYLTIVSAAALVVATVGLSTAAIGKIQVKLTKRRILWILGIICARQVGANQIGHGQITL